MFKKLGIGGLFFIPLVLLLSVSLVADFFTGSRSGLLCALIVISIGLIILGVICCLAFKALFRN